MRVLMPVLAVLFLGGCEMPPQAAGPGSGAQKQFKLTATSAFGVETVTAGEIDARAAEVCPNGYSALSRGPQTTRRLSGIFYTDVTVQVTCAA